MNFNALSPASMSEVQTGTLSLSDVAARIRDLTFESPTRGRDLRSAIRRCGVLFDLPLSQIPADRRWLRIRLSQVRPMRDGVSEKTLSNVRSALNDALTLVGVPRLSTRVAADLPPAWQRLRRRISDSKLVIGFDKIASYCADRAAAPDEFDQSLFDELIAALDAFGVRKDPRKAAQGIARAWNKARITVDGWPTAVIRVPDRRKTIAKPIAEFPVSFKTDLESYLASLRNSDPFASESNRPFAPETIEHHGVVLRRAASLLVMTGRPIETILGLRDLVTLEALRATLSEVLRRGGNQRKSANARNIGLILRSAAARHVKVDTPTLKEFDRLLKRIEPARGGLTRKNQERLRHCLQPDNLQRLLELPELLMAQAQSDRVRRRRKAAVLAQMSVTLAIVLACPLRIKNLTSICLGQHLSWTGSGRHRTAYLRFAPEEVKNRIGLNSELPPGAAKLLETYVRCFRPLLCEAGCRWLFPSRAGKKKRPSNFGQQLTITIRHWTGLDLNPHLFRHLAAKLFLDAHPGEYESVRRILGHKSLQTTTDFYCGFETEGAYKRFDQVMSGRKAELAGDPKLALTRRNRKSSRHAPA